ncbi:MAG: bifunctional adenosylcobinamide kinase/adenosylcobinamide-phosphate guanylyltransferase [Dehalococcoidales bacterium]
MVKKLVLVLGGARSGKSRFAQQMASEAAEKVLFVATAEALDKEMRARIVEHRKNRPGHWRTLETTSSLGQKLKTEIGDARVVIIDCLTLLISNIIGSSDKDSEKRVLTEIEELIAVTGQIEASFIIVSNEVGLGLVPDNPLGRNFRDLAGKAHQLIAGAASEVYFMVAGLPLKLK